MVEAESSYKSVLARSRYDEKLFWTGLRRSLAVHSTLAVLIIILGYLSVKEPIKYTPSIKVDLVALPDIKKSELDKMKMDQFEEPKEESKAPKVKSQKESAPKKEEADFSLKKEKLSKKDSLKQAIDRIKALEAIENEVKAKSKPQLKGNILSKGNSLSGDTAQDMNAYIGKLQNKLRENWNLPIWLTRQNFNAKAVIFLSKTGTVTNTIIAQSSGNQQFDDYGIKTIRQSQPFGPPPPEVLDGGITLGFPL